MSFSHPILHLNHLINHYDTPAHVQAYHIKIKKRMHQSKLGQIEKIDSVNFGIKDMMEII